MNQHFQSYLIGSLILTILWWLIGYLGWFDVSDQIDPGGHFSGTSATTQSLEGFINEVKTLSQ